MLSNPGAWRKNKQVPNQNKKHCNTQTTAYFTGCTLWCIEVTFLAVLLFCDCLMYSVLVSRWYIYRADNSDRPHIRLCTSIWKTKSIYLIYWNDISPCIFLCLFDYFISFKQVIPATSSKTIQPTKNRNVAFKESNHQDAIWLCACRFCIFGIDDCQLKLLST